MQIRIEPEVRAEFDQDLFTRAFRHLFLDIVAFFIREEAITPENLHIFRLIQEVRLEGQNNGHKPIGILEGDQTAGAGLIAAEFLHQVEEGRVLERYGKGFSLGFINMIVKRCRTSEFRVFSGEFLP